MSRMWRRINKGNRAVLAIIVIAAIMSTYTMSRIILSTFVENPTAAQVTYMQTWKNGNGALIADIHNANVTGTLTLNVNVSSSGVIENTVLNAEYVSLGACPVPYYVAFVSLEIYASGSTTLYQAPTQLTPPSGYTAAMTQWVNNWATALEQAFVSIRQGAPAPVPPSPPKAVSQWTLSFNTLSLPNGAYTFKLVATWASVPNGVIGISGYTTVTVPPPPSLQSSQGKRTLSVFGMSFGGEGTWSTNAGGDNALPTPMIPLAGAVLIIGLAASLSIWILRTKMQASGRRH